MANTDLMQFEGHVSKILPGNKYEVTVTIESSQQTMMVICHLSGKVQKNKIRITKGDRVLISVSPYDITRGKIDWRF